MDFITLAPAADNTWTMAFYLVGLALLATMFFVAVFSKKARVPRWAWAILALGGVFAVIGIAAAAVMGTARDSEVTEWKAAVTAEVQESYGIELSDKEFKTLDFPETKPEKDFVAYGSLTDTAKKGDAIRQKTITLIWSDGEMSLVSVKGTATSLNGGGR